MSVRRVLFPCVANAARLTPAERAGKPADEQPAPLFPTPETDTGPTARA